VDTTVNAPRFDEATLARRIGLWSALSDLFLDTDPALSEESILQQIKTSGYSRKETEDILRNEVGPAFCGNLISMTGQWWIWERSEVQAGVLRHLNLPTPLRVLSNWTNAPIILAVMASSSWKRIRAQAWPAP
jgi:hypothetical protein